MIDELLKKYNVKYEDLNSAEKETLSNWLTSLQQGTITTEKIREYIGNMRSSVEQELTKIGHENKQDIFLKARLRNYMLLEAFLQSPEKARKAIEQALSKIK